MKKVAVVGTVWRPHSHVDVAIGKLLNGIPTDAGLQPPRVKVASIYLDQVETFSVPLSLSPSMSALSDALTLCVCVCVCVCVSGRRRTRGTSAPQCAPSTAYRCSPPFRLRLPSAGGSWRWTAC